MLRSVVKIDGTGFDHFVIESSSGFLSDESFFFFSSVTFQLSAVPMPQLSRKYL